MALYGEREQDLAGDGIVYLLWGDLTGLARCRGLPLADLEARAEAGLGWACAGHALTPFEAIVPNVWGAMAEARQIPDLATRFTIPEQGFIPRSMACSVTADRMSTRTGTAARAHS